MLYADASGHIDLAKLFLEEVNPFLILLIKRHLREIHLRIKSKWQLGPEQNASNAMVNAIQTTMESIM